MKKSEGKKAKFSVKQLVKFYTRFKIPWWMYLISLALGLAYAELFIQVAKYTISFNKGELFNGVIIGYSLMTVLNGLLAAGRGLFSEIASHKITYRARLTVWEKILHLPQSEIDSRQPSALISGVTNDVKTAASVLAMIFSLVSSLYGFGRAVYEVFKYNGTLATYMLLLIPLAIVVFGVVGKLEHSVAKRQYNSLREMTEFFSEHISAAKNVKTQALEDREEKEGLAEINKRFKADIYGTFMNAIQTGSFSAYDKVSTVITAIFGSRMIEAGTMAKTGINDFEQYMGKVHQSTSEVLTQYQTLKRTQGAMQYVGELLEGPQEEPDVGLPAPEDAGAADIVLDNVSFGYLEDVPVLKNISVTIPGGKTTAIIGNNGSGKSTLLKLLQGVYMPTDGRILMGDTDVSKIAPHELRRQFGYILQNNPLFSGSVRDNITYGVDEPDEERIHAAAKLADAYDFINDLPGGYDTDVGEGGKLLSGGQRQRVAIARTLITDPNYLLMDEAGASLDHRSDATIFRQVEEALIGKTIILIAHDMRSVVNADRIIVLRSGELEAFGTHDELIEASPTYRGYLEKQGFDFAA